jgi:hypothetical protein
MRIISREKVHKKVISDQGVQKKTDSFSIAVIIISNIVSICLIILAILMFLNS